MFILRIFWTIVSFLLTLLLIVKFAFAGWVFSIAEILPAAVGVFLLFYLLFTLEGQQVMGLQIKDLQKDAIEQFLKKNPVASEGKVFPMHETFSTNFDGFVVGRQIFTIMTVVAISFLINSVKLPIDAFQERAGINVSEPGLSNVLFNFLNGGYFAFASATLVPAWWCQLLSQFIADGRALTFAGLPLARFVLRTAMLLDKLQLGQPAYVMLKMLSRTGLIGERRPIQIGKRAYYDASVDFYGCTKKRHEIYFILGKPSTVKEKITYLFKHGTTERLDHKIQLASPIEGPIRFAVDLPEHIRCQVNAQHKDEEGIYSYFLTLQFNQPIEEQNEVRLNCEYQTNAFTNDVETPFATELSSLIPIEYAMISIQGSQWLLKKPNVYYKDQMITAATENDPRSIEIDYSESKNHAEIRFAYPKIATTYIVEFENMKVKAGTPKKIAQNDNTTVDGVDSMSLS
jgi:hypothetical protein